MSKHEIQSGSGAKPLCSLGHSPLTIRIRCI